MNTSKKHVIICIPGLGGHESSLKEYAELLSEYDLRFLRVVNPQRALNDLLELCRRETRVTLFCNCYGAQLALRAYQSQPETIANIIVVEAFFAEFHTWCTFTAPIIKSIIAILHFTDYIGIRRKRFHTIDYKKLAHYPIYVQPIFDIRWQNLTDYFLKLDDIRTFRLPHQVKIPTLFILSSRGYMRNIQNRKKLQSIFTHATLIDINANTHNIISTASDEIANHVRRWLLTQ